MPMTEVEYAARCTNLAHGHTGGTEIQFNAADRDLVEKRIASSPMDWELVCRSVKTVAGPWEVAANA